MAGKIIFAAIIAVFFSAFPCFESILSFTETVDVAKRKTAASAAGTEKSVAKPRDPGGSLSGGDPYLRREAVVEVGIIFKIGSVGFWYPS